MDFNIFKIGSGISSFSVRNILYLIIDHLFTHYFLKLVCIFFSFDRPKEINDLLCYWLFWTEDRQPNLKNVKEFIHFWINSSKSEDEIYKNQLSVSYFLTVYYKYLL